MCLGMLLIGVFATYAATQKIISYRAATTCFLPVSARILTHDLEHVQGSRGNTTHTWMPVIVYEYTIDDQTYHSNNVLPVPLSSGKDWAQSILAKFPIGTLQTAYYNPQRPNQSYLHATKLSAIYYAGAIMGLLFLFLGSANLTQLLWRAFHA